MHRLVIFLVFLGLATGQARAADTSVKSKSAGAGGKCVYESFKGKCRVTSITKSDVSKKQSVIPKGPGYEGYEVRFRFIPMEVLNYKDGRTKKEDIPNKRYLFLLANSWYPGEQYLSKYGVKEGATFKCEVNMITQGSCAPVTFKFSELDDADYFESLN